MQPEIVQLPDRFVMGYVARIEPMSADYPTLWGQGFDPYDESVSALAIEPGYYGVYYGTEQPEMVDFVAGMIVDADATPIEGLVLRALPGGSYACFPCTMGTLSETWGAIYSQWLPASGYRVDETRPAFEYFPPGMDPEMTIWILTAIMPAESQ